VVTTTTVEVEADVVVVVSVVEVADGSGVVDNTDVVNADVELSVVILDEIISVVEDVESVDTVEDVVATDDVEEDTSVVAVDVDSVVVGVVVDVTVRVELSIGKTATALAAAILETTPTTAKKRIRANAIRTGTDFIQLSLLFTNGCQDWNGTFPYACCLRV
jgi:hypothetical protein